MVWRVRDWGLVVEILSFEFIGLAMIGLCLIVLAMPSPRRSDRPIGDS
jgi:hypothetical protein